MFQRMSPFFSMSHIIIPIALLIKHPHLNGPNGMWRFPRKNHDFVKGLFSMNGGWDYN